MAMFSPVIQALTEATIGKLAQLSAQPSPLRSSSIASSQGIMSPVTDPSVVAAQQSELRQFGEFLSQLSPNAALSSQLLEQVLYDYRSDTDTGFLVIPGAAPKRQSRSPQFPPPTGSGDAGPRASPYHTRY